MKIRLLSSLIVLTLAATTAGAYVDISPSLGYLVKDANSIAVVQVDKVSVEKKGIIFKKVADLKGTLPGPTVRHHIAEGFHPREPRMVLDWAEPGKLAVCFTTGKGAILCLGRYWYECAETAPGIWTMTTGRPELALAYYGRTEQLRDAVAGMLAGKEMVITAVNHGAHAGVWQYNTVAFQKVLRGRDCPVWRLKASLDMPGSVWEVGARGSKWVVGPGFAGTEDIPALLATLEDITQEGKARARAASDLGLMRWKARPALPALLKACEDAEPLVRVRAARAAALVSEEYVVPVATLRKMLAHKDPAIKKAAATSLGDLGADARGAVFKLRDTLSDKDDSVRWAAAEALGRIGTPAAAAVPALAAMLRDPAGRVIAADALGGIGTPARGAVPLLLDALKDSDKEFCWTAAVALTRIDARSARAALPLFIEKFKSPDLRTRWDAAMYIMPMGAEAKAAAPAVREWAKGGNGVAATALAAIAGPDAIDVLPTLLHVLADDWDTSDSIAKIGPAAVPALLKRLKEPDGKSRHLVVKSLGLLAPKSPEVIPVLIGALTHAEPSVRRAAANALAGIEPNVTDAVPALRAALKDASPAVRIAAARALREIREAETPTAVAALVEILTHQDAEARRDAAAALGTFGAAASAALPALQKMQNDGDVRSAAALAAARIATASAHRQAVIVLVAAMKDDDPRARLDAVRALGAVGPDAREAVVALAEARFDDDEEVRRAASESLAKIQPR